MGNLSIKRDSNDAITQEDVDKAIETLQELLSQLAKNKDDNKSFRKLEDDGHYLIIQGSPIKDSSITQFKEGKPIKIKTVFHSVDVEIKDSYGGTFSCTYEIREPVNTIADFLKKSFPKYSEEHIKRFAQQNGETYDETKKRLIFGIAEKIYFGRMAIGGFFHNELKKVIEIVIEDFIKDAELFALSEFGYKLSNAKQFDKINDNDYQKLRKQRIKVINGKGRPQGKSLTQEEFDDFLGRFNKVVQELETRKRKITKNAVARKLYIGHSNPVQQLNRFFERYEVTFETVFEEYQNEKEK